MPVLPGGGGGDNDTAKTPSGRLRALLTPTRPRRQRLPVCSGRSPAGVAPPRTAPAAPPGRPSSPSAMQTSCPRSTRAGSSRSSRTAAAGAPPEQSPRQPLLFARADDPRCAVASTGSTSAVTTARAPPPALRRPRTDAEQDSPRSPPLRLPNSAPGREEDAHEGEHCTRTADSSEGNLPAARLRAATGEHAQTAGIEESRTIVTGRARRSRDDSHTLLQGDEAGRVGGTDTRATVLHRLVRDGVLPSVGADHLRLRQEAHA